MVISMDDKTKETSSASFELKCPNCGVEFFFPDFAISIIQYGLIILEGPNMFIFGCTCRFCLEATITKKILRDLPLPEEVAELYNCIFQKETWKYMHGSDNVKRSFCSDIFRISGEWKYNSFPYRFFHPEEVSVRNNHFPMHFSQVITKQALIGYTSFSPDLISAIKKELHQGSFSTIEKLCQDSSSTIEK